MGKMGVNMFKVLCVCAYENLQRIEKTMNPIISDMFTPKLRLSPVSETLLVCMTTPNTI